MPCKYVTKTPRPRSLQSNYKTEKKKKDGYKRTVESKEKKNKKNNISEGRRFSTTASLAIVIFLAAKESLKVSREE